MRIGALRLATFAGGLLVCFGIPALGQGTPVTVGLNDVNGDPIVTVGGETVYAGVYGGTSNLPGANTGIICDDFADSVSVPQTWSAKAYQASSLNASNISEVLFGSNTPGYANIGIAGYAEIAYLVNLSFKSAGNPTLQGDISEAIWAISSPGLSGLDAAAKALIVKAVLYAALTGDSMSQYTNLVIYVPDPLGQADQPQEMWGTVPEGGAALLYLLLAGLSCFGAMKFNSLNRSGKREIA